MKLFCVSDTHNKNFDEPFYSLVMNNENKADVLIHAGDLTNKGRDFELEAVATFFRRAAKKYKHIVFIAGNHDFGFEKNPKETKAMFDNISNCHYLQNNSITIDNIKFYGAPQTPWFYDWAFNIQRDAIQTYWDEIPDDTDVLITHGPPYGILDSYQDDPKGCLALLKRVEKMPNLCAHIFGHIHRDTYYDRFKRYGNTQFVNASILNNFYQIINDPILIQI